MRCLKCLKCLNIVHLIFNFMGYFTHENDLQNKRYTGSKLRQLRHFYSHHTLSSKVNSFSCGLLGSCISLIRFRGVSIGG